jgi:hypothetical protein
MNWSPVGGGEEGHEVDAVRCVRAWQPAITLTLARIYVAIRRSNGSGSVQRWKPGAAPRRVALLPSDKVAAAM